ncbi:MAG: hypothetical protein ACFFG0_01935 [Candidatus Thorarchaeota archaeon]
MRNPNRIKPILKLIEEIWNKAPDLRLTQLIMNALAVNYDPYFIEDDDLEKALKKYNDMIKPAGREKI